MATINKNYCKLQGSYLFSDIAKRVKAFTEKNPQVEILRLGVGNTTEALSPFVIKKLLQAVQDLSVNKTYTGYGDEQGNISLRQALVSWYAKQGVQLDTQEIFISDGAKCDLANIQSIFDKKNVIAVQNPVYPVYVDSNILSGRTIHYMPCTKNNNFFPEIPNKKVDLIYICSPNNPTGAVATKSQLKTFVDFARKHRAIIIFDAAYCEYIMDKNLPKSIYEIPGAKQCAIEINSFSKSAGFTGVRLGWTVVPIDIVSKDTAKGEINKFWNRRQTTMFNGASIISQAGGLAVLSSQGQRECEKIINYYLENARIIRNSLISIGLQVFGGIHAPYIWVKTPNNLSSWKFFDKLLLDAHVVSTPGSGFGSHGEGYIRLSSFGHRQSIIKAIKSIERNLTI